MERQEGPEVSQKPLKSFLLLLPCVALARWWCTRVAPALFDVAGGEERAVKLKPKEFPNATLGTGVQS